jgi:hypothetical protein
MCAAATNAGSHFAGSGKDVRPASKTSPSTSDTGAGFVVEVPAAAGAAVRGEASPSGARPSETDMFMAVAASMDGASAQAVDNRSQAAPRDPSVPVNPLVAARNASSTNGGGANGALFPIQDYEGNGRSIDTSFAEKGHKHTVAVVLAVIVVVALLAVGLLLGLRWKEAQDARAQIADAVSLVQATDAVVDQLDRAIAAEMGAGAVDSAVSDAMMQSSTTSTSLSDAEALANEAYRSRDLLSDEDLAAIEATLSSVGGRRSLIEVGRVLQTAANQGDALSYLNTAYGYIDDAVNQVQWSADTFDGYYAAVEAGWDTSAYDLWGAVDLDQQAIASIQEAQTCVQAAADLLGGADFSVLDTYLSARLDQLDVLAQMDAFRASGDTASADALNDAYWAATEANGAAWANVPATADELLVDAFYLTLGGQYDAYVAARGQVLAADDVLNGYLGIVDAGKRMGLSLSEAPELAAPAPAEEEAVEDWAASEEEGQWAEDEAQWAEEPAAA